MSPVKSYKVGKSEENALSINVIKTEEVDPLDPLSVDFTQFFTIDKIAFGRFDDSFSVTSLKAYLAEFIATFLFIFAGVGSTIAYNELTSDAALDPTGLVAVALAHTFAVFVCVSIAFNTSGGHLNPAVTIGLAVGGNITLLTGFFYWIAQVLGSIVACLLVSFVTSKSTPTHGLAAGVSPIGGLVIEIVATFGLLYTVYATAVDPRKGSLRTIAPIAIGLIVGANILAFGPFSGASMNPARSFGPAVVSGNYADIWIYWVGPLTGGALGGLIYGGIFLCPYNSVPATETYP